MRRLMGHLAQFSSFSKQGELLCTQGLTYLLDHPEAHTTFLLLLRQRLECLGELSQGKVLLDVPMVWKAEAIQRDSGRPDLEARSHDGRPIIKVEAKLSAPLGDRQLQSYLDDYKLRGCDGILVVVVPRRRVSEVTEVAKTHLACVGAGPWRVGEAPACSVAMVSWEDLLAALAVVTSEPFAGDLANFSALYRVLNGDDLEPVRSQGELAAWRDREGVFLAVVDRVTRRLAPGALSQLPLGSDDKRDAGGYQRRHVCRGNSCFSVGIRNGFQGHDTPVWMRFHKGTQQFAVIRQRLRASSLSPRLIENGGHVWIPLDYPLHAEASQVIESLVRQAEAVVNVAYQSSH